MILKQNKKKIHTYTQYYDNYSKARQYHNIIKAKKKLLSGKKFSPGRVKEMVDVVDGDKKIHYHNNLLAVAFKVS